MKLLWRPEAWEDYLVWQATDRAMLERINTLLKDIRRAPFTGIGKPEPLRANLQGWWSRRISGEHRIVYRIQGTGEAQQVEIVQCRYHYRS